jgi:hypothetical protein
VNRRTEPQPRIAVVLRHALEELVGAPEKRSRFSRDVSRDAIIVAGLLLVGGFTVGRYPTGLRVLLCTAQPCFRLLSHVFMGTGGAQGSLFMGFTQTTGCQLSRPLAASHHADAAILRC